MDPDDKGKERFVADLSKHFPDLSLDSEFPGLYRCLYMSGFTLAEAKDYIHCFEEVNPDLDEEVALKRMDKIRKQVNARKK